MYHGTAAADRYVLHLLVSSAESGWENMTPDTGEVAAADAPTDLAFVAMAPGTAGR
jgi:hypothetical protein